jgi:hypothetical protein
MMIMTKHPGPSPLLSSTSDVATSVAEPPTVAWQEGDGVVSGRG